MKRSELRRCVRGLQQERTARAQLQVTRGTFYVAAETRGVKRRPARKVAEGEG